MTVHLRVAMLGLAVLACCIAVVTADEAKVEQLKTPALGVGSMACADFAAALKADQAMLEGTGGTQIKGVITYSGIGTHTASVTGAASAAGLVNGIASLGQLVSPYLVAWVATRWGWDTLFLCFVGVALAGAAICTLFWSYRANDPLD